MGIASIEKEVKGADQPVKSRFAQRQKLEIVPQIVQK